MKFTSTILVGLVATLATAAPLAIESNTSPAAPLTKRAKPTSNCGLQMYPAVGGNAANSIIHQLWNDGDRGQTAIGYPGKCVMISCAGQASIKLCVNPSNDGRNVAFNPAILGSQIDDTFHDCYGGPPSPTDNPINAIQFWGQGYNLLMSGNAGDCHDMGKPM